MRDIVCDPLELEICNRWDQLLEVVAANNRRASFLLDCDSSLQSRRLFSSHDPSNGSRLGVVLSCERSPLLIPYVGVM